MQPIHTIIKVETVTKAMSDSRTIVVTVIMSQLSCAIFFVPSVKNSVLLIFASTATTATTTTTALLMQGPPLTTTAVCKAQSLLEKNQFLPFERLVWAD